MTFRKKYQKASHMQERIIPKLMAIQKAVIFPELCNAVDFLVKHNHKTRTKLLFGEPLPENYTQLGDLKEFPLSGLYSDKGITLVELTSEINLVLIGIRKYKYEINLFLKLRELITCSLLFEI